MAEEKVPKYMLSKPIKTLTHPVDSGSACSFIFSVFLVAIAIITGFPIVVFFGLFLPVAFLVRRAGVWCSSQQDCTMVAPTDSFWLHDTTFNFHVAHCLFFFQGDLALPKLREIVMARLIQRTSSSGRIAFPRFTQKVVRLFSGFGWVEDKTFDITKHVFQEAEPIANKTQLEYMMQSLMVEPLDFQKPLWEIRVVPEYGPTKETVLIFRIHQSLCDGISLVRILSNCLSDSQFVPQLKPRFGGATFPLNVFRALIVGPITFLAWFLFWRRDYNYLSRHQKHAGHYRVTWSQSIGIDQVNRIKQVTRSTLNDILMTALTGSLRTYFCKSGIQSPPDLTAVIPVDLTPDNTGESPASMTNRYSLVNACLPTNTEGVIPRLWEVRHQMDELKSSADPVVLLGAAYFLHSLLPSRLAAWLVRLLHSTASVAFCNLPGPESPLSLGACRLRRAAFLAAPLPGVPVTVCVLSYRRSLRLAAVTDGDIVPAPRDLLREFFVELGKLSTLLSKRRIPGEHRRRTSFTAERRQLEIFKPPDEEILNKLQMVQEELHVISQSLEADQEVIEYRGVTVSRTVLGWRLEELKEEFSELLTELRRRKSVAEGIHIDIEDQDMDGEDLLRAPRKRALSIVGGPARRPSTPYYTARPLSIPGASLSTPRLDLSPTNVKVHSSRRASDYIFRERL